MNEVSEEDVADPMKETFSCKEAMISQHKKDFIEAMMKELKTHTKWNHWTYCEQSEIPYFQILRSTRVFQIKQNRCTGEAIKVKARFCVDGRSQELGTNYYETYAPVVKWTTIRACLTMLLLHS